MNKRYQVFVSSTYADLKDEREKVVKALMRANFIPAGMEYFPAADEKQLEHIKKIIDKSDYYILIIGGRYGSVTSDGTSYTEQEYEYAIEKGVSIIALIHDAPDQIPVGKTDQDSSRAEKLQAFKDKVKNTCLVDHWNEATQLPEKILSSLLYAITEFPAVGWVRANLPAGEEILSEINELRKENERLKKITHETQPPFEDIADFDSEIEIKYTHADSPEEGCEFTYKTTWRDIFKRISPLIGLYPLEIYIKNSLEGEIFETNYSDYPENIRIFASSMVQIRMQFLAYELIETHGSMEDEGPKCTWSLTEKGQRVMLENHIVKKSQ